ncbi:hypothetical protein MMOR_16520 [Mycolicibacterium moriokaense]|uniref:Uncharacterized protein n=1 Tax=Mycolicibacterium moriokaense TaxID=39691 RepID=A0AAD1H9K1_9MYCO|nr:hypothetical protein MMOR_16520 [Mycolicibacterium moriokaense]
MELELESLDEFEELELAAALSDDEDEDSELLPFEEPLDVDAELLPASRLSLR